MVLPSISPTESHSRTTEDYSQSRREAQVVHLPRGALGQRRNQFRDRDSDPTAVQWPTDLLGLRPSGAGLRPSRRMAVRVCVAVADRSLLRLCDAAGRLSTLRGESGTGSSVRREESAREDLPLVRGQLCQAAFVEGHGRGDWHDLAERVPLGNARGCLGISPLRLRG